MGWLQLRDVTAARFEVEQARFGPTSERAHLQCC